MSLHPGFFASVTFGADILVQPDDGYDVSDLSYAMVLHDEQIEWPFRWTTWGLATDSMLLYQPQDSINYMLVGDGGHLYILDDEIHTDEDAAIPLVLRSSPLPEASDEVPVSDMKRFQNVWWEIIDTPPSTGYEVTIRLTDVNDPTNFSERIVTQTTTRMHVDLTLRCRQAYLTILVTVGKNYNITNLGYSFQHMVSRKTTRLQ